MRAMKTPEEIVDGLIFRDWKQTASGARLKVEQSFIRDSVFGRRVTLHFESSDTVTWSPVTLEDMAILLEGVGKGSRLVLLFNGGGGDLAFGVIVEGLKSAFESAQDRVVGIERLFTHLRSHLTLFAKRKNLFLSEKALRGIMGELVAMNRLQETGLSWSVLLDAWEGPKGGHQDFTFRNSGIALEVKSALALEAKVRVSNERQLDSSGFVHLFLLVVKLKEAPGGRTVPELVNNIQASMDATEKKRMEANLEELKLPKWIRELLPQYRLMEVEDAPISYEINSHSPVVRESDLEIPVSMVSYDLDYSALSPTAIDFNEIKNYLIRTDE